MSIKRLRDYLKKSDKKLQLDLGEITIDKQIGQGGNGLVYSCTYKGMPLAIKFLVTETTGETRKQKIQRFVAEYVNILSLPELYNIVRYIDYDILTFEDEEGILEIPVILMKLYEGALTKKQTSRTFEDFISLFDFLLSTVKYIHSNGIVHRDIKPENILFIGKQFVLADFGIAGFNPEIFKIRATTQAGERIGNRLFSAPEQEDTDVAAHPTMDIYAIGQVLQWFATGSTHRGTGRENISTFFTDETTMYDIILYNGIINKCLEQKPENRFQSISEIKEHINRWYEKDPFYFLDIFHQVCIRNFPKNPNGIVHVTDLNRIDLLFADLKEKETEFGNNLSCISDEGRYHFKLKKVSHGTWRFYYKEHAIDEVWVCYDETTLNDFILVHYKKGEPFIVDEEEIFETALVDGVHHISHSEFNNNWAEINGANVNLKDHLVERISRDQEDGYLFIGTEYSCIINYRNEPLIRQYIDILKKNPEINIDALKELAREVRKNKHPKVEIQL